jgi:PKD repeat protein
VVKKGETFTVSGNHTYADDGSYTVTTKIDDTATSLNLTTATSTATVASVQSLSQDVLAQAAALLAGASKPDSAKLKDVVKKLDDSLDPGLWVDGDHLDPKHGQKVFDSQKDAVAKLMDLLKNKKSAIDDAALQAMIDDVVHVAQILAERAVSDAVAASADPQKIAQAQNELDDANARLAAGDFAGAIQSFRQAWKKAQQAD